MTIAWLKHSGQSLVDLDLYLYDANTGVELDNSEFTRDNVEQVQLGSGSNRSVYLRVHRWGGSGSQTFGLAPPSSFQSTSAHWWWTGGAPPKVSSINEKQFVLYRNYPNPSNPETWVPYQLAKEADVVIRIYNVNGQLVRTLDLGNRQASTYVTRNKAAYWDGKNDFGEHVASGVYFYSIRAGKFSATRKMLLRK